MTIEAVLPQHVSTTKVLSSAISTVQLRPAAGPGIVGNVATFANTLKARSLTSGCAELDAMFDEAGQRFDISPDLLKAVAKVESTFRPHITSRSGAMGIMQLMPGTAKYLGVDDPFDPKQNIMGGAKYLKEQIERFEGDIQLALAAYNAGWPAVKKHGGIPPFKETQAYVPKVLGYFSNGEVTPNMLTYSGFNMNGKINEAPGSNKDNFNFNEALAQMLYIKMIEMQMNAGSNDNSSKVF